jgi:hypothetical protein
MCISRIDENNLFKGREADPKANSLSNAFGAGYQSGINRVGTNHCPYFFADNIVIINDKDVRDFCSKLTHHTPLRPPTFCVPNLNTSQNEIPNSKSSLARAHVAAKSHHSKLRERKMISVFQPPFQPKNTLLRSLTLPSLRVLFESLLSAAPLGVPNAHAFSPLGYAVRLRPTLFACANRLVQKLTTHYATLFMNPWHAVPISRGFENQNDQAPICI